MVPGSRSAPELKRSADRWPDEAYL